MKRIVLCALMMIACAKARTSEPTPSGSATTTTVAPINAPAPDAQVAVTPDATSEEMEAGGTPISAEAIADPVPVTGGRNPGKDLNAQLGGSGTPAQGGRSLVVVKGKTALDASPMAAAKIAHGFVRKGQASVQKCFEDLRAKDPSAKGVLTLRFAVDTNGAIVDMKVEGFNAEVVSCVQSAMPAWKFPAPDKKTRFELVLDLVIG